MQRLIRLYWPVGAAAIIAILLAFWLIKPAPPSSLSIAAGANGGAYYHFAERYAAEMEAAGVTVEIVETNGSVENRALLLDGAVDLAILQGGIVEFTDAETLISLGGIFEEPLWVFVRDEAGLTTLDDAKELRIAIGPQGSGTRTLLLDLREEWGEDWAPETELPLSGAAAAEALMAGEIDAAAFVAFAETSYIQQLLMEEGISLLPFPRAPAIGRRNPSFAPAVLLRGVVDIETDTPSEDVPLIAPVAQLIAPKNLHPALQALALDVIHRIHSESSLMADAGTFPDPARIGIPLSSEAARYYDRGPSMLRRFFPFGVANFLDRTWVMLIPLITLAIPLGRAAPPIYRWRVRRRIYVWYSDLRDLERRGRAAKSDEEKGKIADALTKLQTDAGKVEVPLSYTDDLYRLRNHITFVQDLLQRRWRGQVV
ncbi:MAG: TAXI family TRAP transporter solute-binding subunit [Pseudomonadota bacterium]